MSLRGAISFLGDEWARFHRMIEALEHEAETHHKRYAEPASSQKGPTNSRKQQPHPSLFSPAQSGTNGRWGL
jgi:hypothetical protein